MDTYNMALILLFEIFNFKLCSFKNIISSFFFFFYCSQIQVENSSTPIRLLIQIFMATICFHALYTLKTHLQ